MLSVKWSALGMDTVIRSTAGLVRRVEPRLNPSPFAKMQMAYSSRFKQSLAYLSVSSLHTLNHMRFSLLLILFSTIAFRSVAQIPVHLADPFDPLGHLIAQLVPEEKVPDGLTAQKTLVLYGSGISQSDLEATQTGCLRSGIDAVLDVPADMLFATPEVVQQMTEYMVRREIRFIAILQKQNGLYRIVFAPFNGTSQWVTPGHSAWVVTGSALPAIFESVARVCASTQKRKNFLINDVPETGMEIKPIGRERNQMFMYRLNAEPLAVVKTGNAAFDEATALALKEFYPYKIVAFDAGTPVKDIRAKKCVFVLRMIHTRADEAVRLLGFPATKTPGKVQGISYASGKDESLSVDAETMVWKFFIQQLDNNALYSGNRWDGDGDPVQALRNHLLAFKAWVNRK